MERDAIGTNRVLNIIRKVDDWHVVVRVGRGTIMMSSAQNLSNFKQDQIGVGLATLTPHGWVLQRVISDSYRGKPDPDWIREDH